MACALTERIGPHPKSSFSGLRFRFRAYTLHLAALACLPFRLPPSGPYTSERLTRPYSGELPASTALSQLAHIARLPSHLIIFRPALLLATLVAPTLTAQSPSSSRDVYFRAPRGLFPPHAPDILAVRTGQLTAGDLHPIRLAALSAASPNALFVPRHRSISRRPRPACCVPLPLSSQPQHCERVRCGTPRAAQHCTGRARAADAAGQPLHALAECGRASQADAV